MTEEEKLQIRTLRVSRYSYGDIAKMLNMKRSTVSSYCLRHDIAPKATAKEPVTVRYAVCPNCRKLFVSGSKATKKFCSNKCRSLYWRREQAEKDTFFTGNNNAMTLHNSLDSSSIKSDELDCDRANILYRRKLTKEEIQNDG